MHLRKLAILATTTVAAAATVAAGISQASAGQPACRPAWHLVPLPASMTYQDVDMPTAPAVVSADDVWFGSSDGTRAQLARWNGTTASPAPQIPAIPGSTSAGIDKTPGSVAGQAVGSDSFDSATDGWAIGSYVNANLIGPSRLGFAARWHRGRWTITPLAASGRPADEAQVFAVTALSPDDAWAVGRFAGKTADGALTEHWDGTQWSLVPNPAQNMPDGLLESVSAASPADIWAVGSRKDSGGNRHPMIEHWNGTTWTMTPAPDGAGQSQLYEVSADRPGDVWAAGGQDLAGNAATWRVFAEHWNGTAWSIVRGLPDFGHTILGSIYAASPSNVWATTYANSQSLSMFAHFNGRTWTATPAPGPKGAMNAYRYDGPSYGTGGGVSGKGNDIWASGWIEDVSTGLAMPQLAHLACGRAGT